MEAWLRPMLCDTADDVPTGDEWVLERKLDGWRAIVHRTANRVRLYGGRNGSDYSGKLPYIEGVISRLPADTAVDGELIAPDGWGSVQSVMTRNGEHQPSATSPPLTFVAFDVLRVDGQDVRPLSWQERRALLEAAGFRGPLVFTSEALPSSEPLHEQFLVEGHEGSVAKKITARYVSGSRAPTWVKVKPTLSGEAQVTGFKPGTPGSDFDGTLGALEIRMEDSHAAARVGTGFDRPLRDEIWANQQEWMGALIEIRYQQLGANGVPRFPVFERRRTDREQQAKPPAKKRTPSTRANGARRPRNYKAMKDEKLLLCLAELDQGAGDAYERAEHKHTGAINEVGLCRAEAQSRGLV